MNRLWIILILFCSTLGKIAYSQTDTIIYNDQGEMIAKGKMKNGKKIGGWEIYKDGWLSEKHSYKNNNEVYVHNYKKDGTLLSKYSCYLSDTGKVYFGRYEWYLHGKLSSFGSYINGDFEGQWIDYYPNSKNVFRNLIYKLKNDTFECIEFYLNGVIKDRGKYIKEKGKVGHWEESYESGLLKAQGYYYPKYGMVMEETKMSDGTIVRGSVPKYFKDKKWKYWNELGKLIREEIYDKGKFIETKEY